MARFTEHERIRLSVLESFSATTTPIEKVNLQSHIDELEKEMQETTKTNIDQYQEDRKRIQTFIYILLRDHLPSGTIHKILEDYTSKSDLNTKFSNPYLEFEAETLADAILAGSTFKKVMNL